MPRNSSGTYSLPAGNPVVSGTVISTTWANTTLSDLGTAMTDSLSRSGDGAMLAALELFSGTIGAPGLSWSSESTSGLYRNAAGDFRYSISSTDVLAIQTNQFLIRDGLVGTPGISFLSDTDTGIYRSGTNAINISLGGVSQVAFSSSNTIFAQVLRGPSGSVGSPSYSFSTDTTTGIYRISASNIGITLGGVLSIDHNATNFTFNSSAPSYGWKETDQAADEIFWRARVNAKAWSIETVNDAVSLARSAMQVNRGTGIAITSMFFGNSTDNPTYTFLGTGATTFGGTISASNFTGFANPTGSVALTATNGSATTAMRSDAAPALSQAITPTWSGSHSFTANPAWSVVNSNPFTYWSESGEITDEKNWAININSKTLTWRSYDDALSTSRSFLTVTRGTGVAITSMSFGNTTDNPTYSFLGTGVSTFSGLVTVAASAAEKFRLRAAGAVGNNYLAFYESDNTTRKGYVGYGNAGDDAFYIANEENATILLQTNAVTRLTISTSAFTGTLPWQGPDGSAAAPSKSFSNDTDTGFYRDTANQIGIALAGATAGQIAQGTFTGTLTGYAVNPTGTVSYQRIGNMVFLWTSASISGTSNANTLTMTGLPAIVQPTNVQQRFTQILDNTTSLMATASVVAGTITFSILDSTAVANRVSSTTIGFTASGTKGVPSGWGISYNIN